MTAHPKTPAAGHRGARHNTKPNLPPGREHDQGKSSGSCPTPWEHIATTYTWVRDQEPSGARSGRQTTEEWVFEHQIKFDGYRTLERDARMRRKEREDMIYAYELEAQRWMRHEEELRRRAVEREKEKARLVQEEIRRISEKVRRRREAEKKRLAEERIRTLWGKERPGREKKEKKIQEAWETYEAHWAKLIASSESIRFSDIPWPLLATPSNVSEITASGIAAFLLSQAHSQELSRKERIRRAQLRWHPDRFRRILSRVALEDKGPVEEGANIIARCLNDLMSREKQVH